VSFARSGLDVAVGMPPALSLAISLGPQTERLHLVWLLEAAAPDEVLQPHRAARRTPTPLPSKPDHT
jgi:hypothetical protein